jgi:branched-subunit amino acid aminotransferase/4-amino-4-deoxychorismate lyase
VKNVPVKTGLTTNASLYGKGVFTTIAIIEGGPFLWEKHWRRLADNAAKLGVDISEFDEAEVLKGLAEEVEKSGLVNGRARITFSDESQTEIWSRDSAKKTSLSIITAGPRKIPENFKLTVSPHCISTTSPLAGIKSCNYLEQLMAYDEAKNRGFDEAIRLNERGELTSACMANLFWLKNERLYTPSLTTGCLAGTTREFVLEKLECAEVEADLTELNEAEAVFLTSAGIGIAAVGAFNGTRLSPDHLQLFTEEFRSVLSSG